MILVSLIMMVMLFMVVTIDIRPITLPLNIKHSAQCSAQCSPFFGEILQDRSCPPLLERPRALDLVHVRLDHTCAYYCPSLPTIVGQRTLGTEGRFCRLTAVLLKIATQGENRAARPRAPPTAR